MTAAAMDAASASSDKVQALSESQLGEMANAILGACHSRKQESQADEYAYHFMKQHDYNVVAAYRAFRKFSSHPDSDKRAEEVKKKAQEEGLWEDAQGPGQPEPVIELSNSAKMILR